MGDEQEVSKIGPASTVALEKHYTVAEISELWHLDEKLVRKMFELENDVIVFGPNESRYKRRYRSLRIPESVMRRVHRRLTKVS
ncbi:MAG TPA: hypothetical protein VFK06_17590 [Candidatus Angelobacter sp.]|nr:hypothetical protein [Candidatus Angelobacter sp.]